MFKPACHIMPINYFNRRCTQGSANISLHVFGCMFFCQVASKMKAETHILQRIIPFQSLLKDIIYRQNMQEFNSNPLKALNKIRKNCLDQMLSFEFIYFLLFPIIQMLENIYFLNLHSIIGNLWESISRKQTLCNENLLTPRKIKSELKLKC